MLDAFVGKLRIILKAFPGIRTGGKTITYLIHGNIEHGDSLGNSGTILDGECQWMIRSSGIVIEM